MKKSSTKKSPKKSVTKTVPVPVPSAESALLKKLCGLLAAIKRSVEECEQLSASLIETTQPTEVVTGEPSWIFPEKVPIPSKMYVTKNMYAIAERFGFDIEGANTLFKGTLADSGSGFYAQYRKPGAPKWANWQAAWKQYCKSVAGRQTAVLESLGASVEN